MPAPTTNSRKPLRGGPVRRCVMLHIRRDFGELSNQGTVRARQRAHPAQPAGRPFGCAARQAGVGCGRARAVDGRISRDGTGDRSSVGPGRPSCSAWRVGLSTTLPRSIRPSAGACRSTGPIPGKARSVAHVAAATRMARTPSSPTRTVRPSAPRAADRERLNTFENEVYGLTAEARSVFPGRRLSYHSAWRRCKLDAAGGASRPVEPPGEVFPTAPFPPVHARGIFLATEVASFDGTVTVFPALRYDFYDLDPTDDRCYRHSQARRRAATGSCPSSA